MTEIINYGNGRVVYEERKEIFTEESASEKARFDMVRIVETVAALAVTAIVYLASVL